MAYLAGNIILDDEYNIFISGSANGTPNNTNNNVNTVGATGTGDRGYGQTGISAVSAGTVISATQWATMLNDIATYKDHQGSTITAISNPVTGDPISAYAALTGNIATITTNRLNAAASGTPITAGGVVSRTTGWYDTISMPMTVTFGSAENLRFFFNAGGRIAVSFSRTGGTVDSKNTGWTNLCNACGTINLTGEGVSKTIAAVTYTGTTKIGGSGSPTTVLTATGVSDLTASDTEIFKQFDSAYLYTPNYISINAKVSGAVITMTVKYADDHIARYNVDTTPWSIDELVNGTLTTTVTAVPPSATYLSNTWGTPVLAGSESEILPTVDAIDLESGTDYQVASVGTSDFTLVGAATNNVGETFTPTGKTKVKPWQLVVDKEYEITKVGITDFTLVGASSNTVGVIFLATGFTAGTGHTKETGSIGGTGKAYEV